MVAPLNLWSIVKSIGASPKVPPTITAPKENAGRSGIARFAGFHATASYPRAMAVKLPPMANAAVLAFGSCAFATVALHNASDAATPMRRIEVTRDVRTSASRPDIEHEPIRDRYGLLRGDGDRRGRVHDSIHVETHFA